MSTEDENDRKPNLSRRNILLAGTTVAAASVMEATAPVRLAQAQTTPSGDWKLVFGEQRAAGNLLIWSNPFTKLRVPKLFNLRQDPYERADITSDQYYAWTAQNPPIINQGVFKAAKFLDTFVAYPPSQKAPSFSVDQIMEDVRAKVAKFQPSGSR